MIDSTPLGPNPYVGPRPFLAGEPLFGRSQEVRDLYYLLNAERIVLLYSPSGAGKSSLVQAGLAPRLRENHFDVWRAVRVNAEQAPGAAGNRYVHSTLAALEEGLPPRLRRDAAELNAMSLEQYVETRPRRPGAPPNVALIFDQFEEILTVDPLAREAKEEFFTQLGALLLRRDVWALFVIREDYLAPLDPYRPLLPTQLRSRFRLDLLGLDAAREAIEEPAVSSGRRFSAGVADTLVRSLAEASVQQPDGTFVKQPGDYVEPVQLQVVCRRLWDKLPEDARSIDPEHVETLLDVTQALRDYYDGSVHDIVKDDAGRERTVREWFGKLITPAGTRGQLMQNAGSTGGLDNSTIQLLETAHLIRAEKRRGATWYELAHDRLVKPVVDSNLAWLQQHLEEFQQLAVVWKDSQAEGLLLAGEKLDKAESWVKANAYSPTSEEQRFLAASANKRQQEQDRQDKLRQRQINRRRIWAFAAALLAALGIVGWLVAKDRVDTANAQVSALRAKMASDKAEQEAVEVTKQTARANLDEQGMTASQAAAAEALKDARAARVARNRIFFDLLSKVVKFPIESVLDAAAVPGQMKASDPAWVTLITLGGRPFTMARAFGPNSEGRILAVGHDGILSYHDKDDRNVFLEVAMTWLRGEKDANIVVSAKPSDVLMIYYATTLKPQLQSDYQKAGYKVQFVTSLSDPAMLASAGVVVIPNSWGAFTTQEMDALTDFVNKGGGLLAVGLGWSWRDYGPRGQPKPAGSPGQAIENYPMNQLFTGFGASWTAQ